MRTALLSFLMLFFQHIYAQLPQAVQLPVIHPPKFKVYIATNGSDLNNGDSLSPVATFSAALSRANALTNGLSGNQYGEIVFYPGTYHFAAIQPVSAFNLPGRRNHLSVRGRGVVVLKGNNLAVTPAMIHLLGSNISVKNITIDYSFSSGVSFGMNFNGTVIVSNDILVEDVTVKLAGTHGIIFGNGGMSSSNPLALAPRSERAHIKNCTVYESVNYNIPQNSWGSAIKSINSRHTTVEGCRVYDCEGEGIDLDFALSADIRNNVIHDTKAGIYLDKAEDVLVRNNLIYFDKKSSTGILLGLEPFTWSIQNWYVRRVYIHNNIFLNNPTAFSLWQGTYGGLQVGFFTNIEFVNNTIIGKQRANAGLLSYSYGSVLGQPASNIKLSQNVVRNNVISFSPDSLTNNNVVTAPQNGPHGASFGHNMWRSQPSRLWNGAQDVLRNLLPVKVNANQIHILQPQTGNLFRWDVPAFSYITKDYNGKLRRTGSTNAGAFEWFTAAAQLQANQLPLRVIGADALSVYPNPSANGIFELRWPEAPPCDDLILMVFNASGQQVHSEQMTEPNRISLDNLPQGTYIAVIADQCASKNHTLILMK